MLTAIQYFRGFVNLIHIKLDTYIPALDIYPGLCTKQRFTKARRVQQGLAAQAPNLVRKQEITVFQLYITESCCKKLLSTLTLQSNISKRTPVPWMASPTVPAEFHLFVCN